MKYVGKMALLGVCTLLLMLVISVAAQPETAVTTSKGSGSDSPTKQAVMETSQTLTQVHFRVTPSTPEAMAREYLRAHTAALHLQDPTLSDLVVRAVRESLSGTTVRFHQTVNGVAVYQSDVVVHINHDHVVTYVASQYRPTAVTVATTPSLTDINARQLAIDTLNLQGTMGTDKTQLVVYSNQGVNRLVYQVRLSAQSPIGDWQVLVDATSGELLQVADISYDLQGEGDDSDKSATAVMVDGNGNVFDPDPLSSAQATYGDTGFVDGNDATTAQLDGELVNVVLPQIDFTGGIYTLKGPFAEIRDTEAPNYGLFTQASSTFNFNRFDNAFEAVNTYYHIDTSMRYINQTLGITLMPFQYNGGVRFDPHGLNGDDNSHYSPGSGELAFGEGGVDDAEDADVIYHELGHGLHDWLTNGSLSQVNGLSEGTGDYWAQSYSRSLNQWAPGDPAYDYVFSWDGHNPFWPGRVTNYFGHYPEDLTGSIHTDGQIWATCLMKIWGDIGRTQIDKAVLEGLSMTNSGTNQDQAANAVYQAALDMSYPPSQIAAINARFSACGYTMPVLPNSDFTLDVTPQNLSVCIPDNGVYNVALAPLGPFNDTVVLDVIGEPSGTTAVFSTPSGVPPFVSDLTIGNTGAASAGNYSLDVVGVATTRTQTMTIGLDLASSAPTAVTLSTPPNAATGVLTLPTFTWTAAASADKYLLEVATDNGFATIVYSNTTMLTTDTIPNGSALNYNTTYYWRVTPQNSCGVGTVSNTFHFTTVDVPAAICRTPGLVILDNATATDTMPVTAQGVVQDLNVSINATHTWVGDLSFSVKHVDTNTTVTIIDRPGTTGTGAGCSANDVDAELDDEGSDGPVEAQCSTTPPALFGNPTPNNALSAFDGESFAGTWQLTVTDSAGGDTGVVNEWCLIPTLGTVENHGVDLSGNQADSALVGDTITYTMEITNTGDVSDTFDLAVSGGSWTTDLSAASVTLGPNATTTFWAYVQVPGNANDGDVDMSTVTAVSQADNMAFDTLDLTSTAIVLPVYGVELSGNQSRDVFTGDTMTYTLSVTNTGNVTDTINIVATGVWTTTYSPLTVTLAPGDTDTLWVWVSVPASATPGDSDTAIVTATSDTDAQATDSAWITTTAVISPLYGIDLSADMAMTGTAGSTITYTVWVTNVSNVGSGINLEITGTWGMTLSQNFLVLDAGETTSVWVWVHIPVSATSGMSDTATLTGYVGVGLHTRALTDVTHLVTAVAEVEPPAYHVFLPFTALDFTP